MRARARRMETKEPLLSRDGNNLRISARLPMRERVRTTGREPIPALVKIAP